MRDLAKYYIRSSTCLWKIADKSDLATTAVAWYGLVLCFLFRGGGQK